MRRARLVSLSFVLLISACSRGRSTAPISEPSTPDQSTLQAPASGGATSASAPEEKTSEIPYTKDRRLSYGGYLIMIERRLVNVEGFVADVERAVLKKKGRIIAVFDRVRDPHGASIALALAPVVGDRHRQLVVEQTGPRQWAYWVVALKPRFRVIFNSADYGVGHELEANDVDGDGTSELFMTLHTFWFFDGLCGACSPNFAIAFKYDQRRGVFRPANHTVKGLCYTADELIQAEQKIRVWQGDNPDFISTPIKTSELYSKVLIYALPMIYCGREDLGWSFFDRLYNLPDRAVRKSRIKRTLRRDRVYRAIQNDLERTRREASLHRARVSG